MTNQKMEKLATCKDCGHKGLPKVRLSGKVFLLIPVAFVALILLLANPIVGIVAMLAAYFYMRVNTCAACSSENVVVESLPSEPTPPSPPEEKGAITRWLDKKATEIDAQRIQDDRSKSFVESIKRAAGHEPVEIVVLGGAGWEANKGEKRLLSIDPTSVSLSDPKACTTVTLLIADITDAEISGPGKVTSDLGLMGGGFGTEGALKGMAIATVANLLTTHSNTKTILRLGTKNSELVMLTSQIEPDQARLLLSPIFVQIKSTTAETKSSSITDEIQKLHGLKQSGVITEDEFLKLKQNLIG